MVKKDKSYFEYFGRKNTLVSVVIEDSLNSDSDAKILREDEEPSLVYFLHPLSFFLRLILYQHCSYEFVPSSGENDHVFYRYRPGSWIRKIIGFLIHVAVAIHFTATIYWKIALLGDHPSVAILKIMCTTYVCAGVAFCYCISTKGEKMCKILNYIQEMTTCVGKAGCRFPPKKVICFGATSLLLLYIAFSFYHAFIASGGLSCGNPVKISHQNGNFLSQYFQNCGVTGMHQYWNLYQTFPNQTVMSNMRENTTFTQASPTSSSVWGSSYFQIFMGVLYCIINLYSVFTWVMIKVLTTLSALLFWKIFYTFFKYTDHVSSKNADTVQDIRRFYKITVIIEEFNNAYGSVILMSIVAGVAHYSVHIMDMFKTTTDWSLKLLLLLSFLLFAAELLTQAQVHKTAQDMGTLITTRFQSEEWSDPEQVGEKPNDEATHGIMIVFHDLSTNKIGFRGLQFFTVTYSFIGTVLSVIATYSIVMTQLQG